VHYGALKDGDSTGSDFAGDVVQVGSNAESKGIKIGDAVAGYARGGFIDKSNGAFQTYVKSRAESVWVVPRGQLSYEQAAPMGGIALSTAVQALFQRLNLPTPWAPAKDVTPVLIWAGSTSVGIYAIKLAKMSGLQVATTASPKNHDLLRKLGADFVCDYKDPEAPRKIKEWSDGKLAHAFDTISNKETTQLTAQAFGDRGGKIIVISPVEEGSGVPNVEASMTLIYSALDPKNEEDFKVIADWNRRLPQYASELNVMPLKKWPGGLESIPEALEQLRAGKTSAEKISFTF